MFLSNHMTHIPTAVAAKAVMASGILAAVFQAVPVTPDITVLEQVSRFGITGFLSLSVWALWRKLAEKDGEIRSRDVMLMENYKLMAEALAQNNAVKGQMLIVLEEIKTTVQTINTVRMAITK